MICGVTPITFAHRGARIAEAENTVAAFRRALDLGASGLETDAHLSSDDEVVLVHDAHLGRGRRRTNVRERTAAELSALGVPRLDDVYAALGSGFELSIDLEVPLVGRHILDVARAAGDAAAERLWLCSPDIDVLTGLRATCSRLGAHLVHSRRLGALSVPIERHAADLAAAGVDAMNFHHSEWTAGLVTLFERFGVRAFAWDAQEVRHLRAVMTMGADAVYCDRPERMVAALAEVTAERAGRRSSEKAEA